MFGSSGWWNWSITCGSGGPSRRANATNCAGVSDSAREHQHLAAKECRLELGERGVRHRLREIDVRGLQSEARAERLQVQHGASRCAII